MMLSAAEPRKKGLTALFVDGEFAVKVDTAVYLDSGLKPGDEISDESLHELIENSDARRAYEKGLCLLEYRSHSQKELAEKIARTFPRRTAEEAAQRLADAGLINDAEYAYARASYLFDKKGFSAFRVRRELRQKGISESIIDDVISETEPEPVDKIMEIIRRRYPSFASDEKVKRRAASALKRLGYGWEDIISAFDALKSGDDFC